MYHYRAYVTAERAEQALIYFVGRSTARPASGTTSPHQAGPLTGLPEALLAHAERTGRPVSLVGWSLGGIYARDMARRHPPQIRQVITLGSPFARHDPRQNRPDGRYQRFSHLHADGFQVPSLEERARPIGAPSTAVYSRLDGIVPWQACLEPETERHQTSRSAAVISASASTRPRCG